MPTQTRWSIGDLVESYRTYVHNTCGLSDSVCSRYAGHAREFLQARYRTDTIDLSELEARDLIWFVTEQAANCNPGSAKLITTALRSFLRFLQLQGLCCAELVNAVPTVAHWRLSELPRSLSDEQVAELLAVFDPSTAIGLRDRAMALCMTQLALRAIEVARLSLDEIDWRASTLQISPGKSPRASLLPLPVEVGQAITDYLRDGRPATQTRSVFVRHYPPHGAPLSSDGVRSAIRRAFNRAEIDAPSKGSHILRHTAATRMIRGGATLKEIADILRHRSIDTTAIYAKVDLPGLAEVALPWPEVIS